MKLVSSALSLFLAAPAVYLLRLAAARAIAAPPLKTPKILCNMDVKKPPGPREETPWALAISMVMVMESSSVGRRKEFAMNWAAVGPGVIVWMLEQG